MTVLITLTTAGTNTGPFNLFSDVDGFTSAFETGVSVVSLTGGYTSYLVPNGTTIIRVMSDGQCTNYVDIQINLTTTTTTTIANPGFSYLVFDNYESGVFTFTISNPIYSTAITITGASVNGFEAADCSGEYNQFDDISGSNPVVITSGGSIGTSIGNTPMNPTSLSWVRIDSIFIDGYGEFGNGDTLTIDGTLVTVVISNICSLYVCDIYYEWPYTFYSSGPNASIDVCASPTVGTVYTPFGSPITTGITVYTDPALNFPLTGFTYISEPTTYEVFEINPLTGLVGADTLTNCGFPEVTTTSTTTTIAP